jgi:rubrerythrin
MNDHVHESKAVAPALTRRDAIASGAQLAGVGLLASSTVLLGPASPASAQTAEAAPTSAAARRAAPGDIELLNFALGLEHLELALYTRAAQADAERKYLHDRLGQIVPALREHETEHVALLSRLITRLGGTPVAAKTYNFPRPIFISPLAFSNFAYVIEEVGIGAYLNAIGKIRDREARQSIASINGTESRHSALLRHNGGFEFSPRYYESILSEAQVMAVLGPYLNA